MTNGTIPERLAELAQLTELAERLADLVRLPEDTASSPQRILGAAVELAASGAPNANGASVALWRPAGPGGCPDGSAGWEPEVRAASLPDTARLDDVELGGGLGPALSALGGLAGATPGRPAEPVDSADLITDLRWPAYSGAAVTAGVRAVRAIARPAPPGGLTLTLYAVRAGSFTPDDTAVAVLVLTQTATALRNAERYDAARRDAHQLSEALRGRAVIEQAKGVLVGLRGGDPEEAFAELRRRSQAQNVRLADIAGRVVTDAANGVPRG